LKYVGDEAYVVKRETAVHTFTEKLTNNINMELLQAWRDYLGCNHVLRTDTHFLLCVRIEEAQIINEEISR